MCDHKFRERTFCVVFFGVFFRMSQRWRLFWNGDVAKEDYKKMVCCAFLACVWHLFVVHAADFGKQTIELQQVVKHFYANHFIPNKSFFTIKITFIVCRWIPHFGMAKDVEHQIIEALMIWNTIKRSHAFVCKWVFKWPLKLFINIHEIER